MCDILLGHELDRKCVPQLATSFPFPTKQRVSHFVRVIGLPRGEGVVAGTCCRSLEKLVELSGVAGVEADLPAHYEAIKESIRWCNRK